MKKRLKLKSYVLPMLYVCLFVLTFYVTITVTNSLASKNSNDSKENIDYVTDTIINNDIPVINEEENKMIKPYLDENVKIGKTYYDYKGTAEEQEKSITYHDNAYLQNSGIDYVMDNEFDVVSILDGNVISVKTDDLLGNVIEIKHNDNYVSVYQSLGKVEVKKGDTVSKGQVIGKSGTNLIDKDLGNHLHFELYENGKVVNPILYIDKEIKSEKNKKEE